MAYYDFYRHYSVKANSPQEAKIKFSRALENDEEDQYYVGTDNGQSRNVTEVESKRHGVVFKILVALVTFLGWFFKGAIEQFTYTAPKKPTRYRQY
jgi:hypothetical protein